MADKKISALTDASTPLAGTEVLPIVQSSTTKQVSVANLTAGRSFDALGMTLTSTDAGATAAPTLDLYRDSASPAVSDTLGEIEFNGEDSAGNKQAYGLIHASILSPTSTAEQGQLHFETATAGALTEKMIIGTTNLVINEIGAVFNVRIEGDTDANLFTTDATNSRVGIGTISPAYKLDVNGTVGTGVLTVTGTASTSGDLTVGPINTDNTARTIKLRGSVAGNKDFLYSGRSWDNTGLDYDLGRIRVNNSGSSYGIEGIMNIAVGRNNGSNVITLIDILTIKESGLTVTGSLAKSSGSFRIDHPLKPETHDLVHSFIEGPQADLIYRGKVNLTNGKASVNIDLASGMTEGTFEVLCREVQCFTSNESGWNHVRGSVTGNILTIECQDETASDLISWMVIGERKDKHMLETSWTDDTGKVIVEPLKDKFKVQLQGN
jgi:hypothetical protein